SVRCSLRSGTRRGCARYRGNAKAAKPADEIDVAEPGHEQADRDHHQPDRRLDELPRPASHAVADGSEEEVVVTPCRHGGADEDAVDEKSRGDLLQPQPWPADLAGDDVADDGE